MKAQYVEELETLTDGQVLEMFEGLESNAIGCVNWKEDFPYAPQAGFKVAFSKKAIAIRFEVEEEHVKAVTLQDHGPVWEDSCVEFFVAAGDGKHYFNFEMNCIGVMLAAKRTSRHDPSYLSPEQMGMIRRFTSLPKAATDSKGESQKWWAVEIIPFEVLGLQSAPDVLHANFYKCGDKCDNVHFLSWAPIPLPSPDFHCPQFFEEVKL